MELQEPLLHALDARAVRFVVIGVWGANFYAKDVSFAFSTGDQDFFLPPDPGNLLLAWEACESVGLELFSGHEPLDRPRDLYLARAVVESRALTRATDGGDLLVDLTLVMSGFDFETVSAERRLFQLGKARVPVARLTHIAQSKAAAGRPKDRLFLETHKEMLADVIRRHERPSS
jgi:hypothetical protein